MLVAVTGSPAVHAVFAPTAEFEQLVPVHLHEIQNVGDGVFLLLACFAKSCSADVNMQPTSRSLMRTVSHVDQTVGQIVPRELVHVVIN